MEGGYGAPYYSEGYDEDEADSAARQNERVNLWGREDGRSAKDIRPVRQDEQARRRSLKFKVNKEIYDLLRDDHIKFMEGKGEGRENFEYLIANKKGEVTELGPCLLDKDERSMDEKKYYEGIIRRAYQILEQEGTLNSDDTSRMLPKSLQEILSRDEIEAEKAAKAKAEQERLAEIERQKAAKAKAEQERLAERERQKAHKKTTSAATQNFFDDMFVNDTI